MPILQTKAGFLELRKALKGNNGYILGCFSYADVTMAVALQAVEPVGPPISKYATRSLCCDSLEPAWHYTGSP